MSRYSQRGGPAASGTATVEEVDVGDAAYIAALAQLKAKNKTASYKNARFGRVRQQPDLRSAVAEELAEPVIPADVANVGPETQVTAQITSVPITIAVDELGTTKSVFMGVQPIANVKDAVPLLHVTYDKPEVLADVKKGTTILLPEELKLTVTTNTARALKMTFVGVKALPNTPGHGVGEGWVTTTISTTDLAPGGASSMGGVVSNRVVYLRPYNEKDAAQLRKYKDGILAAKFSEYHIIEPTSKRVYAVAGKSMALEMYHTSLGKKDVQLQAGSLVEIPRDRFAVIGPSCKDLQTFYYAEVDMEKFAIIVEPVNSVSHKGLSRPATFASPYGATNRELAIDISAVFKCRICDVSSPAEAPAVAAEPTEGAMDDDDY